MKVLVIEDDREIVEAVSLALKMRWPGAKILSSHLGEKGLELVEKEDPDVVILDLGLADVSGFDVLKQLRQFSDVPVIILTVRSEETDIVKGLEWGADDYVVKPFRQLELLARVRALMRRQKPAKEEQVLVCGPLQFDPTTRKLSYDEREVTLTRTEALILHCLMQHAGHVVTHSMLAEAVWGTYWPGAAGGLKVHVRRLRGKLEENPSNPRLITTKPGIGYSLSRMGAGSRLDETSDGAN